jgi:hypothetical protein
MSPLQSLGSNPVSFSASGTPAIPHAKFWAAVPGHVSDGVNFTVCQCCGMRGGGAYAPLAAPETQAGYGAV